MSYFNFLYHRYEDRQKEDGEQLHHLLEIRKATRLYIEVTLLSYYKHVEHDWRIESDEVIEEGVSTSSPIGERDGQETTAPTSKGLPPKNSPPGRVRLSSYQIGEKVKAWIPRKEFLKEWSTSSNAGQSPRTV